MPADSIEDERHEGFVRLRTLLKPQGERSNLASLEFDLSKIFAFVEENKESFGIISYSVSQATLEQIFIQVEVFVN